MDNNWPRFPVYEARWLAIAVWVSCAVMFFTGLAAATRNSPLTAGALFMCTFVLSTLHINFMRYLWNNGWVRAADIQKDTAPDHE